MGKPAAKQGDQVVATDMHLIQPPGTVSPVMIPHPFAGEIDGTLSSDVNIMGRAAATVGSTATNKPSHLPQGGTFVRPPKERATIEMGSTSVLVNGNPAARSGDAASTCNDPADMPVGTVVASGSVYIG